MSDEEQINQSLENIKEREIRLCEIIRARDNEITTLRQQLAEMTINRDQHKGVWGIDRKHQGEGPRNDCCCPSCELHRHYKEQIDKLNKHIKYTATVVDELTQACQKYQRELAELSAKCERMSTLCKAWKKWADNEESNEQQYAAREELVTETVMIRAETPTDSLAKLLEPVVEVLQRHHEHGQEECFVLFQGESLQTPIYTNLGESYAESELCDDTIKALDALKPFCEPK